MTNHRKSIGNDPGVVSRRIAGRRHGRKLRSGLQRLMDDLLPQIALSLPKADGRLEMTALLGHVPKRLWLEIGFGAGEHLAWQARNNPDVEILGAEIYVNGIAALLRKVQCDQLTNIRILQGDGQDLLARLPDASIERLFVLFPDPWPKQRHNKRRLIQRHTLDTFSRILEDGAELRIATDHGDYLRWILEKVCPHSDFFWTAESPDDWRNRTDDWPATRYETKAIEQGRKPAFLRFVRRPR